MLIRFSMLLVSLSVLIKFLAIHYTNFDLFGDEAQYWLWSKSPDLGYYSKPPLLAWLLTLHTFLFGSNFEALKYFPLFFYFFTTYLIYLLSCELYEKKDVAIMAALTFYLLPSVTVSSFLISTDVVLVFISTFLLLVLLKIRKNPGPNNFVILGIFFGLAFLTKYAAIYYIVSLILFIISEKDYRKKVFSNKLNFFLFFVCFFTVLFPNILWNIQNGWVTITHTSDNAGLNRANINLKSAFEFILAQIAMLGPVLFFSFILFFKKIHLSFQTKFLLFFSLPVFSIVLVESALVRANANWAAIGMVPIFLLMFNIVYNFSKKMILYNNIINFIFCFTLFFLISTSSKNKVFDRITGISVFSKNLKTGFLLDKKFLIVQDRLLYSSLSYSLRNSNKKILTPYKPNSDIKSHFQISSPLTPEHDEDFIFIGEPHSLNYLTNKFIIIEKQKTINKFFKQPMVVYEVVF